MAAIKLSSNLFMLAAIIAGNLHLFVIIHRRLESRFWSSSALRIGVIRWPQSIVIWGCRSWLLFSAHNSFLRCLRITIIVCILLGWVTAVPIGELIPVLLGLVLLLLLIVWLSWVTILTCSSSWISVHIPTSISTIISGVPSVIVFVSIFLSSGVHILVIIFIHDIVFICIIWSSLLVTLVWIVMTTILIIILAIIVLIRTTSSFLFVVHQIFSINIY